MKFTRSKIICTIGPATNKLSILKKLNKAGMNVARINMSHATHSSASLIINKINKINSSNDGTTSKIAILLDTQGPEIRTGDTNIPIDLNVGDEVTLTVRDEIDVETSSIKVNYKGLVHSVDVGSKITVDNGLINFKVLSKESDTLLCKVIPVSYTHLTLPTILLV